MRTIPNMTVIVPCDEKSVYAAVEAAICHDGPVYIRMGRLAAETVYQEKPEFAIGKGNVLKDGTDLTIAAVGDLVPEALKAAAVLEEKGVSTAVLDLACVKPIDEELIKKYARKTGKIITAEDHNVIGGLGSAVSEIIAQEGTARMQRVGIKDCFGRSGTRETLQDYFKLNVAGILEAYERL